MVGRAFRDLALVVASGVALSLAPAASADAPVLVPIQGTLADSGGTPVEGAVTVHFGVFGSETGGTALWTEDQTVTAAGGMVTAYLGAVAPLDLGLFRDNGVLYLEIGVGDSAPLPRMQLATTPYAGFAQYCGDAGTLAGAAIGDLAPAGHDHDGRYYTETEMGTPGSASVDWANLASVPAGFADGIDDDTTYTAGLGLQLAGTRFSAEPAYLEERARAACYDTQAELRTDLDAVYAPLSHSTPWATLTGVPPGFADGIDADTTYSAGTGLSLAGTTFGVQFAGTGAAASAARSDHAHGGARYYAEQTAAVSQVGQVWTDLTGARVALTLAAGATADLWAGGSVTGNGGTRVDTHCGFRFVVDGGAYGNVTWGDQIIGVNRGGVSPGGWWESWTIARTLTLAAGSHTIQLQMTGWSGSDVPCFSDAQDYSRARLYVTLR